MSVRIKTEPATQEFEHSVSEISTMLAQQVEPLCRELLPGGRREAEEWRVGSIAGEAGLFVGRSF